MDDILTNAKPWWLGREAERLGVDWGWLWLHRNGFAHHVPDEVKEKIEGKKRLKGGNYV